jgi:hypothetical protein
MVIKPAPRAPTSATSAPSAAAGGSGDLVRFEQPFDGLICEYVLLHHLLLRASMQSRQFADLLLDARRA